MKTWFVFLINGEKIGVWANNDNEARQKMIKHYGDIPMEFIGIDMPLLRVKSDHVIYDGMSAVDIMIATGLTDLFAGMRDYGR